MDMAYLRKNKYVLFTEVFRAFRGMSRSPMCPLTRHDTKRRIIRFYYIVTYQH